MKNVNGDVGNARSPTFTRAFKIDNHMTSLFSYTNVVQVSFFDLYDDGYLDVLLTLKERDQASGETTYKLVAFKNEYFDDVYFIKMMGQSVGTVPTPRNNQCPRTEKLTTNYSSKMLNPFLFDEIF